MLLTLENKESEPGASEPVARYGIERLKGIRDTATRNSAGDRGNIKAVLEAY